LELTRRLLGEEHPDVAQSLNNLASLYYSQGRYAQAEQLIQQALELTRHLLGEEHPDVATSLNNLALLYYSQGRYAQAEPLFQQALELTRRLLEKNIPTSPQASTTWRYSITPKEDTQKLKSCYNKHCN
jgi:tetratricopeptide (TPR) repeat protein